MMTALGFLFADEVADADVIQTLATALEVSPEQFGMKDLENMPDTPYVVEIVRRGPEFRTDVSVVGPLGALDDVGLAAAVQRASGRRVLCSAPGRTEPFWILIDEDGGKQLVRARITDDNRIVVQEILRPVS